MSLLSVSLSDADSTLAFIGAFRTGSVAIVGWAWVDGTDVFNLNCGAIGCSLWDTGEPK